jgi:hypothetical protein
LRGFIVIRTPFESEVGKLIYFFAGI